MTERDLSALETRIAKMNKGHYPTVVLSLAEVLVLVAEVRRLRSLLADSQPQSSPSP